MRARVWKQDGIWHYRTYDTDTGRRCQVFGTRPTWRHAFDSACQELLWMCSR